MLEGKAVLIIDDDSMLLNMYGEQLKFEGMLVEYAKDGSEALKLAKDNHPNIIILDVMMPKINGLEVLRLLKSDDDTKDIPVIMLSALNNPDQKSLAEKLGAKTYLVKSEVLPIDVVNTLNQVLG